MDNICRTCTRLSNNLQYIFDAEFHLPYKIAVISGVEIAEGDDLPSTICEECVQNVSVLFNFRKVIINSDLDLKERSAVLRRTEEVSAPVEWESNESAKLVDVEEDQSIVKTETHTPILTDVTITKRPGYSFKSLISQRRKPYFCKSCNFSCTESLDWKRHKRTKHDLRKVCNICGKSFYSDNLQKHINSHTDKPVNCPVCGKTLKNTSSLRSHSIFHSDLEYVCEICGKIYKHRGEYNRHTASHNPNREKKVKCPMCDKMFYNSKYISQHIKSHTGMRPHVCQVCGKGFASTYGLKVHKRLHTNEKPFVCEFCSMAFRQKCSLNHHIKLKHEATNS